jgi:hypothetical protein
MRLYGSVNNRINEHGTSPTPAVGDGATIFGYTDRYAGTVVAVKGATVTVREDNASWEMWPSGYAKADGFTPNPNGRTWTVTLRHVKGGTLWRVKGSNDGVRFGVRQAYRDPHF